MVGQPRIGAVITILLGVLVLMGSCGSPEQTPDVQPAEAIEGDHVTISPPQPLYHQVELLKNPSFEEEAGGFPRVWVAEPANPEWKTDTGKNGGTGFVLQPPQDGRAQVAQVFGVHPSVAGLTLQAQMEVRCPEPGAAVLEVEFDAGGRKILLTRENSGTSEWETLMLRTKLPAGANAEKITFRLAAYSGVKAMVIDEASAMMTTEPVDPTGIELVANGSFERAISGQAESWDVLPKTVGALDQSGPAGGKNAFKLSPLPGKAYSTLQQALSFTDDMRGLIVNAQVKLKGAEAKRVGVMLIGKSEGKEGALSSADSTGAEGWETLAISVKVPEEGGLLFRVALRPGATAPVLIDEASARLARE